MRCSTCQHKNPDGAPFCAECGSRLQSTAPAQMVIGPTGTLPQATVLQERYIISEKLGQGGSASSRSRGQRPH